MKTTLIALTTLLLAASAQAQQAPKPEQLIKWRQSAYQVIGWNTGRVKANVDGTYNKDDVIRAANTIAAVANGGLPTLFAAGTDSGKGWHDTSVKATLFSDAAGAAAAQAAFGKEANELARVAQGGDVAAVKAQLAALQKTCKACHDDYRNSN
ncbi:c-type cytochrome [Roseateles sp. NT4]|uniref:c-type cytochrome n=1 Tax=Roseateles sp. NT4 TaxID=3453715 RepID=UPI003EEA6DCD